MIFGNTTLSSTDQTVTTFPKTALHARLNAMAKFEVREVIRLSSLPSIVFAGRIIEGTVRAGMMLQIELQPGLYISCAVHGVEYLDRVSVGESLVALRCPELDLREAAVYGDLCPPGTVVNVLEPEDQSVA